MKGTDPSGGEEAGASDQPLPQHLLLDDGTIDASPDSPPETAPSAEGWKAPRIPVYQVRRPTGHVEHRLPFSPPCAAEMPRALPSAPPLEHGTLLNEYARKRTPLTTSIPKNLFEFVADDVTDEFAITPLFEGSTNWRLIAVDSVLSLLRRRQLNVVHAGLYHANSLITAERLLLWEYDPSDELYPYDKNNQLSKLLTAAEGDAFHEKRKASVVIVLKPAADIATVVLLDSPMSAERPPAKSLAEENCCISGPEMMICEIIGEVADPKEARGLVLLEVYYPPINGNGYQTCMQCGKHGKFRLSMHMSRSHGIKQKDDVGIKNDLYENIGGRPSTRGAPVIPRGELCYTANVTEDPDYRGGSSVHYWFLKAPQRELMFDHEQDDWSEGEADQRRPYYVQTFSLPPGSSRGQRWMNEVDEQLKLRRKLDRPNHAILQSYSEFLEIRTVGRHPRRKRYNVVRDAMFRGGGYFVVDEKSAPSPQGEGDAAADPQWDVHEELFNMDQPASSSSEKYDSSEEQQVVVAAVHEMAEELQAVIEGEHDMEQEPEEQPIPVAGQHDPEDVLEEQPGVEASAHEMAEVPEEIPGTVAGEHGMEQEPEVEPALVVGEQGEPEVDEELPMIADPAKVLDYMRMHKNLLRRIWVFSGGPFIPQQEIIDMKRQVDPVDAQQVADYEVEYNAYLTDTRGNFITRKYTILAHERIYKGADDYPTSPNDVDIPLDANALLQLLCVAYKDAYKRGNPVVLMLKRDERLPRLLRKGRPAAILVVLLGRTIPATELKRYGNLSYTMRIGASVNMWKNNMESFDSESVLESICISLHSTALREVRENGLLVM
ncbi:hypothetical protein TELCIR_09833 [Teladorsagia circumcincta]|uniref:Uncharacterized protein n=1 Tax=Teladorsagia circumcincta TaxID=45464 RepID=A0A2G9UF86_TELCI|nr:hypothetical protein TELCIR_09833 [Teladorsagia circumcincta]